MKNIRGGREVHDVHQKIHRLLVPPFEIGGVFTGRWRHHGVESMMVLLR